MPRHDAGRYNSLMEMKIIYQKKDNWFIGHIQEYPDYETQGKTLDELKENLADIYHDISNGLVPDPAG